MATDAFAARLRELRESAGLTQKELAERVGITTDGLSKLERGERRPTWDTVLALAGVLGVECTAFTQQPTSEQPEPKRGRPRKAQEATEPTEGPANHLPQGSQGHGPKGKARNRKKE